MVYSILEVENDVKYDIRCNVGNTSPYKTQVCQTENFPNRDQFHNYEYHSGRFRKDLYDKEYFDNFFTGIQGWQQHFKTFMTDERLKEIAKFAFKLETVPDHVQCVYRFDINVGYNCPDIIALVRK